MPADLTPGRYGRSLAHTSGQTLTLAVGQARPSLRVMSEVRSDDAHAGTIVTIDCWTPHA